jgi:hypothetical protein
MPMHGGIFRTKACPLGRPPSGRRDVQGGAMPDYNSGGSWEDGGIRKRFLVRARACYNDGLRKGARAA